MGMNFYCHKKPTQEYYDTIDKEYITLGEIIKTKDINAIEEQIVKIKEASDLHKWHIGKRSSGWAFSFQANPKEQSNDYNYTDLESSECNVPWEDNLESIKEFLSREDIQIINEENEEFTAEQFWNEEINDCLYVDENHYSHETYYKEHPYKFHFDGSERMKDNIRWMYCWFC